VLVGLPPPLQTLTFLSLSLDVPQRVRYATLRDGKLSRSVDLRRVKGLYKNGAASFLNAQFLPIGMRKKRLFLV
jgi:hypothetical protein